MGKVGFLVKGKGKEWFGKIRKLFKNSWLEVWNYKSYITAFPQNSLYHMQTDSYVFVVRNLHYRIPKNEFQMNFEPNGKKDTQKKFGRSMFTIFVQADLLSKYAADNSHTVSD